MIKEGNKYYPLFVFLSLKSQNEIKLSFGEVEARLNSKLPKSAHSSRAWWSNRKKGAVQAAAWVEAGYYVADVCLQSKYIIFRKRIKKSIGRAVKKNSAWNGILVKALRQYMGLTQSRFAKELQVRQQTISEWENGIYLPSRAMSKYLSLIAERTGFNF